MALVKETDHVGKGTGRLIAYFKNKPTLAAWLSSYLKEVQAVEDFWFQLLLERWPDDTTYTDMLDILGRIVGQPRGGLDNDQYRLWIKARVLVNKSSGTANELLEIAELVSQATLGTIQLTEDYPAGFYIELSEILSGVDGFQIADILHEAKGAGIGFQLYWYADAATFTFSDTDVTKTDATLGFADSAFPSVGGYWASSS